jgi:hypothetical protein
MMGSLATSPSATSNVHRTFGVCAATTEVRPSCEGQRIHMGQGDPACAPPPMSHGNCGFCAGVSSPSTGPEPSPVASRARASSNSLLPHVETVSMSAAAAIALLMVVATSASKLAYPKGQADPEV